MLNCINSHLSLSFWTQRWEETRILMCLVLLPKHWSTLQGNKGLCFWNDLSVDLTMYQLNLIPECNYFIIKMKHRELAAVSSWKNSITDLENLREFFRHPPKNQKASTVSNEVTIFKVTTLVIGFLCMSCLSNSLNFYHIVKNIYIIYIFLWSSIHFFIHLISQSLLD